MASKNDKEGASAGSVVGGIFAILGVIVIIGLKVYRSELRAERADKADQKLVAAEAECLEHAHALMDKAPGVERIGEYLHWGVRTYHAEAWEKSTGTFVGANSSAYRDAIIDLIVARASQDGREEAIRALEKLKLKSRVAGEQWWEIKPL